MKKKMIILLVICITVGLVAIGSHYGRVHQCNPPKSCILNLNVIDAATKCWALERNKGTNAIPSWAEIGPYIGSHPNEFMECPQGGKYSLGTSIEPPKCSIGGTNHSIPPQNF